MFVYARPALIRAFVLANGGSSGDRDPLKKRTKEEVKDDDYVSKSEWRLLLVATHAALRIYRVFDVADESNDRKVSREEWDRELDTVNAELSDLGYTGPPMEPDDFDVLDEDMGGSVMLEEAMHFFLAKICGDKTLVRENHKEAAVFRRKSAMSVLSIQRA